MVAPPENGKIWENYLKYFFLHRKNKKNGYFSINSEKLLNISDANFNKNYLTAKSPERARSCSPTLLNLTSSIATTSANYQ